MSELKTYSFPVDHGDFTSTVELFYLKSEADKVIAEKDKEIARLDDLAHAHNIELLRKENLIEELKESHKKEVGQLLILNREQANAANRLRDSMEQVIRHQKYKRCLANAEICCEKKENCYNRALRKYSKDEADYLIRKSDFWQDWEFRWLKIAEKFKEGV